MARIMDVHHAMYGDEPTPPKNQLLINQHDYNMFLAKSFDWYNNNIKDLDKKKWVIDWGIKNNLKLSDIKNIPESYLSTVGSMVRMEVKGFQFNKTHRKHILDEIEKLIKQFKNAPKKNKVKRHTIDNVALVMTDFDNAIDAIFEHKKVDVSINYSLTASNINELKSYYNNQIEMLADDSDNYLHKGLLNKHREIITLLNKSVKVAIKKPRVKKPIPKHKQVAKLHYMKESIGVKSINPEKIIGALKLVVFNTNNRKLTIFYADDDSGFKIKGSTLLNFSKKSGSKTIRKPEMKLVEFLGAPKVRTDKIFNEIKSVKGSVTGRINNHCILVKVF